ncbi:MAG: lipase [Spirochaetia bacterium]|nr:lipase [Spirochaetia bacterium]
MKLVRFALLALLSFVLLEAGLRIVRPRELQYYRDLKLLHVYNPDYLVGLAPGVDLNIRHHAGLWEGRFTTNSLGFRASPEPRAGERYLGCLGDSLVLGFGVSDDDTFCRDLDGIEFGGKRFRTINLAVDALGSMGSAKRLDDAMGRVKLDTVLFFVSPNDFTMPDNIRARGILSDDETDELRERDPSRLAGFRFQFELTRSSYAVMCFKLAIEQLIVKWQDTRNQIRRELVSAGFIHDPCNPGSLRSYLKSSFYMNVTPAVCERRAATAPPKLDTGVPPECAAAVPEAFQCRAGDPPVSALKPLMTYTTRAYDRLIESSRRAGIRLIVVLPTIQDSDIECASKGRYAPSYEYALRAGAYFRSKKIPVIETRAYAGEASGEPVKQPDGSTRPSVMRDYIIPGDGHYTALGNHWLGRALKRELVKLK